MCKHQRYFRYDQATFSSHFYQHYHLQLQVIQSLVGLESQQETLLVLMEDDPCVQEAMQLLLKK